MEGERLFLTYGEAQKLREKYPGKIPIFVTRARNANDLPDLPKHKFLAPSHLSVGQFLYVIRKHIQLPPEKALFVFVNNTLPTSSTSLAELYTNYRSNDGALRMTYTSENTFGFNPYSYSCSSSLYSFLQHRQIEQHQRVPLLL
jgi:GABA(A) receptor-associated protein